ncbi:LysM peptidoglycan-binding domain-containing protein, partial [Bacillus subtilis]|uniref:LysM peptidoglycan-binding domain-containing protein n=1 Tax=Bacillus subtilis TaxID=1423 RepID=UPI0023EC27C5
QVESSKKVEAKKHYSKSVSISKAEEASKQSKIESSKKEQSLAESKRASESAASSAAAASESARKASESAASESKASMLSNSQEVTVNDGDTLATLASQYGTTAQAIQDLNDMGTSNSLTAGQTIRVPNSN